MHGRKILQQRLVSEIEFEYSTFKGELNAF